MKESKNYLFSLYPVLLLIPLLFALNFLNSKSTLPEIKVSVQDRAINLNKHFLNHFNLGNKRMLADILWIQTLLESDFEHYQGKDLNSWLFLRLDSITDLDPNFLEAYRYGGIFLSVIKDDDLGAKTFFEKGLNHYPEDYVLLLYAGLHYAFELNLYDHAFKHLSKIQYHPQAPKNLPSIVSRLKAESSDLETTYELNLIAYNQLKKSGDALKSKYAQNLYAIRAEIDLKCLNESKNGCNILDYDGNHYLRTSDGSFKAARSWKKFRLNR